MKILWRTYIFKYWPNPSKIFTVYNEAIELAQASDRKSNQECLSADFSVEGFEINKVAAIPDKNTIGLIGVR